MSDSINKTTFSTQLLQLIDAALVVIAAVLSEVIWDHSWEWLDSFDWIEVQRKQAEGFTQLGNNVWVVAVFIPLTLELFGFYKQRYKRTLRRAIVPIFETFMVIFFLLGLITMFFKLDLPHRPTLVMVPTIFTVLILLREQALQGYYRRELEREENKLQVVLAGAPNAIDDWLNDLSQVDRDRMHVVQRFDLMQHDELELDTLLSNHPAERVVFLVRDIAFDKVTKAVETAELQGIEAWIAADFVRARIAQPTFDVFNGQSMLVLRSTPSLSWSLFAKDVLDRISAAVLLVVSSPLWLISALGVKLCSPGPVFFRQERAGRYGKPFMMWKFRTMNLDADQKLAEVKESAGNDMSGPVFKLEKDPRVFKFGDILRRTSIDELPQLINVIYGEMSMVGPRPLPVYEVAAFERSAHRRRLSVKPGITCTWQAGGRNRISSFEEWVQMDLEYIDNWSLWEDFKIVLMTVPAVLFRRGAK